jgi:hypothetical protein
MSALAPFAPAALGTSAASESRLTMSICSGDGLVRAMEVPLDQTGGDQTPCNAKGCHGGANRKKAGKRQ